MHWTRISEHRRSVAVVGDLMLDEQIQGAVHRISPEAPVPVVRVTSRIHHPGGAANVARNIVALSADATLAGITGVDEASRILRARLAAESIGADAVIESPSRSTSRKSRVLAHGYHHLLRFDEESTEPLSMVEEHALWNALEPVLARADALVLSDYAKGVLTANLCARTIARAAERGIPVVVDPKEIDLGKYRGASVITPNWGEALQAARALDPRLAAPASEAGDDGFAETVGRILLDAYGSAVVLTRGPHGMSVFERGAPVVHIPAKARRVFDVTGAGDTVVAVLALALAARLPLRDAAAMSNVAAGHVVQLPGTAVVTLAELGGAS